MKISHICVIITCIEYVFSYTLNSINFDKKTVIYNKLHNILSYKNHSLKSISSDYYNCEEPIPKNKGIHLKVDDVSEIIVSDKNIKVVLPDLEYIKITITFESIVEYSEKYTLIKADEVINKYSLLFSWWWNTSCF